MKTMQPNRACCYLSRVMGSIKAQYLCECQVDRSSPCCRPLRSYQPRLSQPHIPLPSNPIKTSPQESDCSWPGPTINREHYIMSTSGRHKISRRTQYNSTQQLSYLLRILCEASGLEPQF